MFSAFAAQDSDSDRIYVAMNEKRDGTYSYKERELNKCLKQCIKYTSMKCAICKWCGSVVFVAYGTQNQVSNLFLKFGQICLLQICLIHSVV